MRENRRFVRVRPSGLVSKSAKIILSAKSPAVDCNVLDISAGGACIEADNAGAIPKRFVLFHGGTKKSCVVIWRTGRRLGVAF
jgi:PilZ domain-containing protein